MLNVETVDVYDLLFDYVRKLAIAEKVRKRIDFDKMNASWVIDKKFKFRNLNSRHETQGDMGRPQNCVIFSSTFINSTSTEQTNSLRTEKRTTATCRLQLTKSVMRNGNISLQISPPNTLIQANGGFSKEKTLTSEKEEVMEEELSWSLDTQVVVQPGHRTKADLVITEGNYNGAFKVDTLFEGIISVVPRDKKDKPVTLITISKLTDFLKPEKGFQPVPNKPGAVIFTNEGVCKCSYGIEQHVELKEESL
ncbi:unnamed protein product [Rodentolepis nana]|uniref:Reverse transcriptase domain-containing protein n=1 Tax=Rodentolepis nana TaxID=102285 RepID=A0A0R3TQ90_RODNA|nr:unnamed protein product [Rodentolepis nana]